MQDRAAGVTDKEGSKDVEDGMREELVYREAHASWKGLNRVAQILGVKKKFSANCSKND